MREPFPAVASGQSGIARRLGMVEANIAIDKADVGVLEGFRSEQALGCRGMAAGRQRPFGIEPCPAGAAFHSVSTAAEGIPVGRPPAEVAGCRQVGPTGAPLVLPNPYREGAVAGGILL